MADVDSDTLGSERSPPRRNSHSAAPDGYTRAFAHKPEHLRDVEYLKELEQQLAHEHEQANFCHTQSVFEQVRANRQRQAAERAKAEADRMEHELQEKIRALEQRLSQEKQRRTYESKRVEDEHNRYIQEKMRFLHQYKRAVKVTKMLDGFKHNPINTTDLGLAEIGNMALDDELDIMAMTALEAENLQENSRAIPARKLDIRQPHAHLTDGSGASRSGSSRHSESGDSNDWDLEVALDDAHQAQQALTKARALLDQPLSDLLLQKKIAGTSHQPLKPVSASVRSPVVPHNAAKSELPPAHLLSPSQSVLQQKSPNISSLTPSKHAQPRDAESIGSNPVSKLDLLAGKLSALADTEWYDSGRAAATAPLPSPPVHTTTQSHHPTSRTSSTGIRTPPSSVVSSPDRRVNMYI